MGTYNPHHSRHPIFSSLNKTHSFHTFSFKGKSNSYTVAKRVCKGCSGKGVNTGISTRQRRIDKRIATDSSRESNCLRQRITPRRLTNYINQYKSKRNVLQVPLCSPCSSRCQCPDHLFPCTFVFTVRSDEADESGCCHPVSYVSGFD